MTSELASVIQALSRSDKVRPTKVGRIRELLPDIERAQHAGVRLADIADALRAHGFDGMDPKCLQNLLYQARRRNHRKQAIDDPPAKLPATVRRNSTPGGIDAESIFEVARKTMASKQASGITLDLLRSQSHNERK